MSLCGGDQEIKVEYDHVDIELMWLWSRRLARLNDSF